MVRSREVIFSARAKAKVRMPTHRPRMSRRSSLSGRDIAGGLFHKPAISLRTGDSMTSNMA